MVENYVLEKVPIGDPVRIVMATPLFLHVGDLVYLGDGRIMQIQARAARENAPGMHFIAMEVGTYGQPSQPEVAPE